MVTYNPYGHTAYSQPFGCRLELAGNPYVLCLGMATKLLDSWLVRLLFGSVGWMLGVCEAVSQMQPSPGRIPSGSLNQFDMNHVQHGKVYLDVPSFLRFIWKDWAGSCHWANSQICHDVALVAGHTFSKPAYRSQTVFDVSVDYK